MEDKEKNPLKDLNLTDNFMFIKTFSELEIFEKTAALLLGEKVAVYDKMSISYEKASEIKYTRKGVRYDVKLGNNDKLVDIEMERVLRKSDPLDKRASIYSSHMIIDSLNKGEHYKDKKDTHTIFICNFMPFEIDSYHYKAKYECSTVNENTYVTYNTGDYHHFFNMVYEKDDIPKELKELFEYIKDTRQINVPKNSELINIIHDRVQFIKNSENIKEEYNMMNLYENEIYADAHSKGVEQGIAQGIAQGIEQGIEQGVAQGIEQGIEQGKNDERNCLNLLNSILIKAKRFADLERSTYDKEFQQKLIKELLPQT